MNCLKHNYNTSYDNQNTLLISNTFYINLKQKWLRDYLISKQRNAIAMTLACRVPISWALVPSCGRLGHCRKKAKLSREPQNKQVFFLQITENGSQNNYVNKWIYKYWTMHMWGVIVNWKKNNLTTLYIIMAIWKFNVRVVILTPS